MASYYPRESALDACQAYSSKCRKWENFSTGIWTRDIKHPDTSIPGAPDFQIFEGHVLCAAWT